MPDPLGKRLIRSLLNEKNLAILTEHAISEIDLSDDALTAYRWVTAFIRDHGEWPTCKMLEENTAVFLPDDPEPLHYISDLVRRRSLGKTLEHDLTRAAELLEARKPDDALRLICEAGLKHRHRSTGAKLVSYRGSGEGRIKAYEEVKSSGGYVGIPTPWKQLNESIQGWVNGTLNVVTAMQNSGKSWFTCINADHCMTLGKRVLLVTLEMPANRIGRRLDAVRYKIPFQTLRDAEMDPETETRWAEALRLDAKGDGDILIADKKIVRQVSDVLALVMEHRPDIVLVDGGYRFEGSARKGNWESTVGIVNELQWAAELTDIPWVVTTQQGDSSESGKEVKRGPKMRAWNVRYGKEWVINPDVVIGLYQDEDLRMMTALEIHRLKVRDIGGKSKSPTFSIHWNLDTMSFAEKDVEEPIAGGTEDIGVEY